MIWIPNQLIGAGEGQQITLECISEAYPKSINYWTRDLDEIVPQGKLNIYHSAAHIAAIAKYISSVMQSIMFIRNH